MSDASRRNLVRKLLERYGQTYASEAGIRLDRGTPAPLFQLLCLALLLSARIRARAATEATGALLEAGLTTPERMAKATWQERVDVLTNHGYKRYDERTSTQLGALSERVLSEYGGDLRRLRDRAERRPERERDLLLEFKGIGPVGGDIFLREVQGLWDEVYPYADQRVLESAERLGLALDATTLARLVPRQDFARLAASLVRVERADVYEDLTAVDD